MQPNSDALQRSITPSPKHGTSFNRRRLVAIGVRVAFGIVLLLLVFKFAADFRSTVACLRRAAPQWLVAAAVAALVSEFLTAWKWKLLLRHVGENLPYKHAVAASFVGMFYNNLFPGSVGGDIARALHIASHVGGKARAAASAFMQRNTGMGGLLLVAIPASILWLNESTLGGGIRGPFALPIFWFSLAALGYLAANILLLWEVSYRTFWAKLNSPSRWERPVLRKILNLIHRLHLELQIYRRYWMVPLLLSVLTQFIDCMLVWFLALALGAGIPYYMFLIAVPFVTLAAMAPVSFNGIGLREIAYVLLFAGSVTGNEMAVGVSLLQLTIIIMLSTVGGLVHLLHLRRAP
jgi:glycosyltransferase 2 family protein